MKSRSKITSNCLNYFKKLSFWLLSIIFTGGMCFLILEVGLHVFVPSTQLNREPAKIWVKNSSLGWSHGKNVQEILNTGERDVKYCTNEIGYRVSCSTAKAKVCNTRILVVGDSFTAAEAIPFEQTAFHRLKKETNICFYNAGVSAYGISQYKRLIEERIKNSKTHYDAILIIFYVGNDFTHHPNIIPIADEVSRRNAPFKVLPKSFSKNDIFNWFYPINSWLETWSYTYVQLRQLMYRILDKGDVGNYGIPYALLKSKFTNRLQEHTINGIKNIAKITHEVKLPLIVVILPFRNQVLDPTGKHLARRFQLIANDIDMNLVSLNFIPKLKLIPGLDVIDLLPDMRMHAHPNLWGVRDSHLSPEGHAIWFNIMLKSLNNFFVELKSKKQLGGLYNENITNR